MPHRRSLPLTLAAAAAALLVLAPLQPVHAGKWSELPDLPEKMGEVAAAVAQNELYLVGERSDETYVFSFADNEWRTGPKRPKSGNHHTMHYHPKYKKILLTPGLSGAEGVLQILDVRRGKWATKSVPWDVDGSAVSAVFGKHLLICGGIYKRDTVATCGRYHVKKGKWKKRFPNMPIGVNHAAFAKYGGKFFVFGGRDGGNWVANGFDHLQILDYAKRKWTVHDNVLPQARGGMGAAAALGSQLYVMGGETKSGDGATKKNVYERVDIYDAESDSWSKGDELPKGLHGIYPVAHDGKIYVAGGGTNAGYSASDVFFVYEP